MKEKCISCGIETNENLSTDINYRNFYVEGSGQLCRQCYERIYDYHREGDDYESW